MTTKTIAGTYSAGYLLNSAVNTVSISGSGSVGGFGLVTNARASVVNAGRLDASGGANGLTFGVGGGDLTNGLGADIEGGAARSVSGAGHSAGYAGGAGVSMAVYGTIHANLGNIIGGIGGGGLPGSPASTGGAGGAGVHLSAGGYVRNQNLLLGGAGGAAGESSVPASGGAGGDGVWMGASGAVITQSAEIYGGMGGTGGLQTYSPLGGYGGNGGQGGDGINLTGGGGVLIENGLVAGGMGGHGGDIEINGAGGDGGTGGTGVSLGGAGSVANSGTIIGGAGGLGGGHYNEGLGDYVGAGGAGGTGVVLAAGGGLTNTGVIRGGAGGIGAGQSPFAGDGPGGYGVRLLAGGTVVNTGTIVGGRGGTGTLLSAPGNGILVGGIASITNGSSSDKTAFIGVASSYNHTYGIVADALSAVTVTNFGTIAGYEAVVFGASADTLVVEAGCVFQGGVHGSDSTLVLGSGAGTVSGFTNGGYDDSVSGSIAPTTFHGFTTLEIGSGASFALAAGMDVEGGGVTDTLIVAGEATLAGSISVEGVLDVSGKLIGARHTALEIDGGMANFNAGAVLRVPTVEVSGAALVTVDDNLKFAGRWQQSGGTLTIEHGKTLAFTSGGSSFSGLLNEAGKGIGHINFTDAAISFDYFNGATISGLVINDLDATFQVGAAGATIASGASVTFDGGSAGILGLTGSDVLTNKGDLLGAGRIGEGQMSLVNNGAIVSQDVDGPGSLTIDTGANAVLNTDVITADSANGLTVASSVVNNGLLIAQKGIFTLEGAVSGTGSARIIGGTLSAASVFDQAVTFTGAGGTLELGDSQAYGAAITGFALTGGTSLDLDDIGFVDPGEATFSGSSAGGVLTVTDGTRTARIALTGDYLSTTFVSASDSHGGVAITTQAVHQSPSPAAGTQVMIAAMAAMGGGCVAVVRDTSVTGPQPHPALFVPRVA